MGHGNWGARRRRLAIPPPIPMLFFVPCADFSECVRQYSHLLATCVKTQPKCCFFQAQLTSLCPYLGLHQCFTVTAHIHCSTTPPLPTTPPTRCWTPWNHRLGPSLHLWGFSGCSVHRRPLLNSSSNSNSSRSTRSIYLISNTYTVPGSVLIISHIWLHFAS